MASISAEGENGQWDCWAAPRHQSLPKSKETFDDPYSQGPCGHIQNRSTWGLMHALDPNAGFCRALLVRCRKAWPSLQQTGLA